MKIHPNERTLGRLVARVGRGGGRRVLQHLVQCEPCRSRLARLLSWDAGRGEERRKSWEMPWTPQDYGAVLDRLVEASAVAGSPLTRAQVEAPVLMAELLLQPSPRRRLLLRNSPRFRSWPLAELLLDRSRDEAFEDPAQAESLARLGLEAVSRLDAADEQGADGPDFEPRLVADLRARGLAYLGNALRMRSDLRGAEEAMQQAQESLSKGTGDPLESARLLDLLSSLRRDQRRLDEALQLLDRAVVKYESVGDTQRAARALVTRSMVLRDGGESEQALSIVRRALASLQPGTDSRLYLCARHNEAFWLTDLERWMEAYRVFRDSQPLYDAHPDPWTQRRRAWVHGRILHGLGQRAEAEERLAWAQRGFVEQEIAYDAALVSLDLAALYAEDGRSAELKALAAQMMPIFRARDLHREALAALDWFRRAAELETASATLVHALRDYLQRARHDPSLAFEKPADGG